MRKLGLGILAATAILLVTGAGAYAAPKMVLTEKVGPYEGTFQGVARADRGSTASLTLDLTHRGDQVEGMVSLDEGLYVDAGWCGPVEIPALSATLGAQTVPGDPSRLVANPTFDAGQFDLKVQFESRVSSDGDTVTAKAVVDLPWFCGRDPSLSATLYRD